MGTIAEKLTYLNDTKQELKEAINNLGGSITSETTFREYAQELQDIYDNIPKTTDTGTNLSLNTIKGKMELELKGNTSQETTTGKQLIPTSLEQMKSLNTSGTWSGNTYSINNMTIKVNDDLSLTLNGTNSTAWNFILVLSSYTLSAGNYTLSLKNRISGIGIYTYTGDNVLAQFISGTADTSTNKSTFTLSNDTTYTQCRIYLVSGTTYNNITIYPMIESGSSMTEYEKYTRKYC